MKLKKNKEPIIVYCDGASSGNPGPSGWAYLAITPDAQVFENGGYQSTATNNQMELMAVIEALRFAKDKKFPLILFTDSQYVLRGIQSWIHQWRKNSWKTKAGLPVANQSLWETLGELVTHFPSGAIQWQYVPGHSGVPGNERVDQIAVALSLQKKPELFRGTLAEYSIPRRDLLKGPNTYPIPSGKSGKNKNAVFYLSLVNDQVQKHQTWEECKSRVTGQSHAKYKKVRSPEEEQALLEAWGKLDQREKGI